MRPPTSNRVTTTKHGAYSAVDYASSPDVTVYAPEDGYVMAYLPNNGSSGNALQIKSGNRIHSFCHLERPLVGKAQNVSKGQPIAIMGWTGLVIPAGPGGRHLHAVLSINGQYVYPPDHYNEPFQKGNDDMVIPDADNYYWRYGQDLAMRLRGRQLSRDEFKRYIVGQTDLRAIEILSDDPEATNAQHAQDVGTIAMRDNWQQQIYDLNGRATALQSQVSELSKRPAPAEIEALETRIKDMQQATQKAAECVAIIEPNRPASDIETKPADINWFTKVLALIAPKPKV